MMNLQNIYLVRKNNEVINLKILIFIGGATACGKSTLVNSLNENIPNSIKYRRHQGFFDIASQKNIPKNEIYKKITSDQVDDWFVSVCNNSDVVISDVHYAVQMSRNGIDTNHNIDIHQSYVPTISKDLLNKISSKNIRIVAIFLSCSPEQCLCRAISRYNESKKYFRNISIEDATIENFAEEREWNNILSTGLVDGLKLNSEQFSVEQLTNECFEYLKKHEEKALKKVKNDKSWYN